MPLGIDPKVDYAFKRVFGDQRNADLLIHLVNSVLRLPDPIVTIEILNPFNEKDLAEDKLAVLDIKARDQTGRLLNVEMQLALPRHFRGRILYYWAGLYRQQIAEGERYDQLRPAVTICLLNQRLFSEVEDYHMAFDLYNMANGLRFTDLIQIHLLELPKFRRTREELRNALDKWLYFFRYAETMDPRALPAALEESVYQRAVRELEMLTKDDLERERYEARVKGIRDHLSFVEDARQAQEDARQAQEDARQAQEDSRRAQEEARQAQEEARQAQEDARQAQEEALRTRGRTGTGRSDRAHSTLSTAPEAAIDASRRTVAAFHRGASLSCREAGVRDRIGRLAYETRKVACRHDAQQETTDFHAYQPFPPLPDSPGSRFLLPGLGLCRPWCRARGHVSRGLGVDPCRETEGRCRFPRRRRQGGT